MKAAFKKNISVIDTLLMVENIDESCRNYVSILPLIYLCYTKQVGWNYQDILENKCETLEIAEKVYPKFQEY